MKERDLKMLLLALKMEEKAMNQAKEYRSLEAGKDKEVGCPLWSPEGRMQFLMLTQ